MNDHCDRYWLLTWTTYGTWLPGDVRGFVSPNPDEKTGEIVLHNIPDTPYDADMPDAEKAARSRMLGKPIYLVQPQAAAVLEQFHETANYRHWTMLAAAVMCNHAHIVVGVPGDPDPSTILQSYKSYASRKLNKSWPRPASDSWWTESGSKRKMPTESAVLAAVSYVEDQPNPLALWIHDQFRNA